VASKKTLNATNLEALGAARLSELMIEMTKGDIEAKRRLRLELAGTQGSGVVAAEVRKRLTAIARSHSYVEWDKIKKLITDLELQRSAIITQVGKDNPVVALELMWQFLALANSVFERSDDGSGRIVDVFHTGVDDLGELAVAANTETTSLADQVYNALIKNDYGQYDYLIRSTTSALGEEGLEHLRQRFIRLSKEPLEKPAPEERQIVAYGPDGPFYADDYAERRREGVVNLALQEIADAQGDVDAFIEQKSEKARTVPAVAAEIAERLLAAGRVDDAWAAIEAVDEDQRGWLSNEWEQVKIKVFEALGREDEAKQFQWSCFERSLNATHLRAFLKRLPDFDDLEVEELAMRHALQYPGIHQSLSFLISWPSLENAAELVLSRTNELDGNHYEILTPAADALHEKHPLAATLLRRALIDFALVKARRKRYRHAARHLLECDSLAGSIENFGTFDGHEVYLNRLISEHGRKSMFWDLYSTLGP